MFSIHTNYGEPITFPDEATFDVEESGRLRVYIGDTDVALFADGGWYAVTRPLPASDAPEAAESDDEDEFDEEV